MFVRVKKIKGRPYAYLVENEWTPWGSRQRVTKYLGKTIQLERLNEQEHELPSGIKNAVKEAIAQELNNHGFLREENTFKQENITVNLEEGTITQRGKNIVLGMNEGFLCTHTLQQLLSLQPSEEPDPTQIASHALEAGLKLNEAQFLHIFEQLKRREDKNEQ